MLILSDKQLTCLRYAFIVGNIFYVGMGCLSVYNGLTCCNPVSSFFSLAFGCYKIILGLFGWFTVTPPKGEWMYRSYKFGMQVSLITFFALICHFLCRPENDMNRERKEMVAHMENYNISHQSREWWDENQKLLDCCGIDGYKDWGSYGGFNVSERIAPTSCCIEYLTKSFTNRCYDQPKPENLYRTGCFEKKIYLLHTKTIFKICLCLAMSCVTIAGIAIISILVKNDHKEKNKENEKMEQEVRIDQYTD